MSETPLRVVVAGATGYLGKFVALEFARRGHRVRVLTRSQSRLEAPGPFTAPAIEPGAVVEEIAASGIEYSIVRPSGYYSDMGAVLDMAKRGRVLLVGSGDNRFNPIHGADLARVCVDATLGDALVVEAGGPEVLTQREVAELAFRVLGKSTKVTVVPMWLARGAVGAIRLLSRQFGDLAEFIVTAGEVDAVAPLVGRIRLEDYFRELAGDAAVPPG